MSDAGGIPNNGMPIDFLEIWKPEQLRSFSGSARWNPMGWTLIGPALAVALPHRVGGGTKSDNSTRWREAVFRGFFTVVGLPELGYTCWKVMQGERATF
jgi:hypothetical protein